MAAKLTGASLKRALSKIRIVFFDFDGVMTDNRVWVSQDGSESVACNRSDGLGIGFVRRLGIPMFIVSTETNPVVHRRAAKLKMECFAPCDDKIGQVNAILKKHGLELKDAAFVGNDVNDLESLINVGFAAVVGDAYPEVKRVAHLVLKRNGGHGAVREFCDLLVNAQKPLPLAEKTVTRSR